MFDYNTKIKYFTDGEEKHLKEFMKLGIKEAHVYTTEKSEAYQVLRIFQPAGLITPTTNFSPKKLEDNSRNYACPNSALKDIKEFKLIYRVVGDDEHKTVTSKEFMKMIGTGYIEERAEKIVPEWIQQLEQRRDMLKAQAQAKTQSKEEFEEKTKSFSSGGRKLTPKK